MNQALPEAADLREHDPVTVGAYLTSWLDHTRGRVRAKTHDGYQAQIRLYVLPRLEGVLLTDLHPLVLQHLYGDLLAKGLSGGTVLNLHLVLTQALAQAARWGLIPANPAAGAQPPRPRRPEIAVVDPPLAGRILEAVEGTRFEVPAAMAIATGMRRGEILALRWSDLDEEFTTAHVRRTLETAGGKLVVRGAQDPALPASRVFARVPPPLSAAATASARSAARTLPLLD